MRVVQLMASPFFGGPERQMLGLSRALRPDVETLFLTFAEGGKAQPLVDEVRRAGMAAEMLTNNFPAISRCAREIADRLTAWKADVVCTSGYKPDILGWLASRRCGVPQVIVSHGWTAATWKVRMYEAIDRFVHRKADAVVSVSEGQAAKVRATGVPAERMTTIVNAVGSDAFAAADPSYAAMLREMFSRPVRWILGAAGRFSPEKGMDTLVEAAAILGKTHPDAGVVIFGEGPTRPDLEERIGRHGLNDRVVLAGFRGDVGKFLPHLDVGVLPSNTEGLPVILLEMLAAGRPVVATSVGGIPEVIADGSTGWLVPAGQPETLAKKLAAVLDDDSRGRVGEAGRAVVRERFGVERQAKAYQELLSRVARLSPRRGDSH